MNIRLFLFLLFLLPGFCDRGDARLDPKEFVSNAYQREGFSDLPPDPILADRIQTKDVIDSLLPSLGDIGADPVSQLGVGEIDEKRALVKVWEERLKDFLLGCDEGLGELWEENERYRFENEHFLKLRRAELKQLYQQLEKAKERLEKLRQEKERDIQGVKSRIRRYYDEIDAHLESPHSAYNDSFVMGRKNLISRLVRKESSLKADYQNENYPEMERLQKQVSFFGSRIEEIYQQSKDMSFEFIVKRKRYIAENNAKINYRVALALKDDRGQLAELREWLSELRTLKQEIEELEKGAQLSYDTEKWEVEEQARFEEEYYRRQRARDQKELDLRRHMREHILENRSSAVLPPLEDVDEPDSVAPLSLDGEQVEKTVAPEKTAASKNSGKDSPSGELSDGDDGVKTRYIYIVPADSLSGFSLPMPQMQVQPQQARPPARQISPRDELRPESELHTDDGGWQRGGEMITDPRKIGEYEEYQKPRNEAAVKESQTVESLQKELMERLRLNEGEPVVPPVVKDIPEPKSSPVTSMMPEQNRTAVQSSEISSELVVPERAADKIVEHSFRQELFRHFKNVDEFVKMDD
jgi:hypothetical protein